MLQRPLLAHFFTVRQNFIVYFSSIFNLIINVQLFYERKPLYNGHSKQACKSKNL